VTLRDRNDDKARRSERGLASAEPFEPESSITDANAADALAPFVAELTGHRPAKTDAVGEGVDSTARLESLPTLMPLA
jgi:hypothetical protein